MRHAMIGLALCALATPALAVELTPDQIKRIEDAVKDKLKDPASAMIGDLQVRPDPKLPSMLYVCGTVNAKNSFGGYTGKAIFMAALVPPEGTIDKKHWAAMVVNRPDDAGKVGGAAIMCAKYGMHFR